MHRFLFLSCCLLLSSLSLLAQMELTPAYPVVTTGEENLSLAWEGGLNSPQLSKADFDGDGQDDLFVFDRLGSIPLIYRSTSAGSYEPAHELLKYWPTGIINWVLIRDYNQDGTPDIFAYSDTVLADGILVYKGLRRNDGLVEFERLTFSDPLPLLYYPQQNGSRVNIYVSDFDYPAVDDVDCDGDLDILTFNIGGGFVEFFRNTSVEDGNGLEGLNFVLEEDCYGGIFEPGITSEVDLASGPGECAFQGIGGGGGGRHAGSTLLTFDEDGDGVKELMLGDVSFSDLNLLHNGGNCDQAWFDDQEPFFPQSSTPLDLNFFPAGFYLDFNQDGKRDLIGTPNQKRNAEDRFVMWYYENTNTDANPTFEFRSNEALVGEMIDLGTGSFAASIDANADGKMDLVLSNTNSYTTDINSNSHLELYLNQSTGGSTIFRPTDFDYLDMLQFNNTSFAFAPTFGDMDQDGDTDALVGAADGKLFYFQNMAGVGAVPDFANPIYFWQELEVDRFVQPRIVDVNRDGLADLVCGTRRGAIDVFINIGTSGNPDFNPDVMATVNIQQFGSIDARVPGAFGGGYASPWLIPDGDDWIIFTPKIDGVVAAFRLSYLDLNGEAVLIDPAVGGVDVGEQGSLLMANFDDDPELEVVLGNLRGGVSYYNSNFVDPTLVSTQDPADRSAELEVYPNPTNGSLFLSTNLAGEANIQLYDLQGRSLQTWRQELQNSRIDLTGYPAGVYSIRITSSDWSAVKRIVID